MMAKKKNYEVGYGKPPQHTRFQKGQSGNPSGKPKKVLSEDEFLLRELASRVTVGEGGKKKRMSKFEVVMKKQIALAMQGEHKAVRYVTDRRRAALDKQLSAVPDAQNEVMRFTLVFDEEEERRRASLREENPDWTDDDLDRF